MTEKEKKSNLFRPGQSGNPAGRPKGSKNKTTMVKQALEGKLVDTLAEDANDIILKAISLAKQGDPQMIKLLLDKILPNARGDGISVEKGTGGINIVISGMEKPTVSAERVEDAEIIEE